MSRPALEVADIFRGHGPAWRQANAGHVSLGQLKVMSAIASCRTAALGGHVARCENENCGYTQIAYNSCLMGRFRNGELATWRKFDAQHHGKCMAAVPKPLRPLFRSIRAKDPFLTSEQAERPTQGLFVMGSEICKIYGQSDAIARRLPITEFAHK